MMQRLAICLVIVLLSLAGSHLATAQTAVEVYDAIDSVELRNDGINNALANLLVTGILQDGTAPITKSYRIRGGSSSDNLGLAMQCQRLAILVMSKPGKFRFAIEPIGSTTSCKLIRRNP